MNRPDNIDYFAPSSMKDLFCASQLNKERVRSLWKKFHRVEKWDETTGKWVDVSNDKDWDVLLSECNFKYYVNDYPKLRFILYKTNENGNLDIWDRYNDLIFTANPFADSAVATTFKNVKITTQASEDGITFTDINTYT